MQVEQKIDPVANNLWHVISALEEVKANIIHKTQLLGKPVSFSKPIQEFRVFGIPTPLMWLAMPSI